MTNEQGHSNGFMDLDVTVERLEGDAGRLISSGATGLRVWIAHSGGSVSIPLRNRPGMQAFHDELYDAIWQYEDSICAAAVFGR